MMQTGGRMSLGELLVKGGAVTTEDMDAAISASKTSGERLGEILLKMSLVDEETLARYLGEQLMVPYVRLSEIEIPDEIVDRVPAKLATHYQMMPMGQVNGTLQVAVNDPLDIHLLDDLRLALRAEVELAIASEKQIRDAINK